MAILNDFLSKLPRDKLIKCSIKDDSIVIASSINSDKFYTDFKDSIKSQSLTPEKAIYVSSRIVPMEYISSINLLNKKVNY